MTYSVNHSVWGCTRYENQREVRRSGGRKHRIDQERSAREGDIVAFCGIILYYVDGAVTVREGDPCSGKTMVDARTHECVTCNRRQIEREITTVTLPIEVVRSLAMEAPGSWAVASRSLDAAVVASVNSR